MASSPESKVRKFYRLDDLLSGNWRPLTLNELRSLNSIKLTSGEIKINRTLLALLLGERERLAYTVEVARWVEEELDKKGLIKNQPLDLEPPALERACALLKESLKSVDGIYGITEEVKIDSI
tara:strand:- start:1307 stop:1675 length:369 start_codon:yes stop_codon:yes gene_type:complete